MAKFSVEIIVYTKPNIQNPQGETLVRLLKTLNIEEDAKANVGKYYKLDITAENENDAKEKIEKISMEILSNPLIEDFKVLKLNEINEHVE